LLSNSTLKLGEVAKAYETMGDKWLTMPPVLKFLSENKGRTNKKYLQGLCKELSSGHIPTDEEARNLGFNKDIDIAAVLAGESASSTPQKASPSKGQRSLRKSRGAGTRALFN
jgi:hypothetical protein